MSEPDPKRLSEEGDLAKLLTAAKGTGAERVGARERIWKSVVDAPAAPSPLRILVPAIGLMAVAAIAFVALRPAAPPLPAPIPETFATLTLAAGEVQTTRGQEWSAIQVGDRLAEGAQLRTAEGARAYARFASAGALFREGTRAALGRGRLTLALGAVALSVRHGTGGLTVAAGDYTVAVTGTVFQVKVGADRAVDVFVHEGSVQVRGPATDVTVRAGESWSSRTGAGRGTMEKGDVDAVRLLGIPEAREARFTIAKPVGAEITIDGVPMGRAPVTVLHRVGGHDIAANGKGRRALLGPEGTVVDVEEAPLPALAPPAEHPVPLKPGEADAAPALQKTILAREVPAADRDTARYELARLLSRRGQHGDALMLYAQLARAGAWAEPSQYEVGRLRLKHLGDPAGAVEAFTAYRARFPKGALGPEVSLSLIEAHLENGTPAEALKEIDLFLATYPGNERAADVRRVQDKIK